MENKKIRIELVNRIKNVYEYAMSRSEKTVVISSRNIIFYYKEGKLVISEELSDYTKNNLSLSKNDLNKLERYYYKGKLNLEDLKELGILLESKEIKDNIQKMWKFYYDTIKRNFVVRDMFFTVAKDGEILLSTQVIL